eukprot:COSAG05_NODE_1198_length_5555_cov_3.672287_7_plen_91_part_00
MSAILQRVSFAPASDSAYGSNFSGDLVENPMHNLGGGGKPASFTSGANSGLTMNSSLLSRIFPQYELIETRFGVAWRCLHIFHLGAPCIC